MYRRLYKHSNLFRWIKKMVKTKDKMAPMGFEPTTIRLRAECSDQTELRSHEYESDLLFFNVCDLSSNLSQCVETNSYIKSPVL
jgi:hypothetical protein